MYYKGADFVKGETGEERHANMNSIAAYNLDRVLASSKHHVDD